MERLRQPINPGLILSNVVSIHPRLTGNDMEVVASPSVSVGVAHLEISWLTWARDRLELALIESIIMGIMSPRIAVGQLHGNRHGIDGELREDREKLPREICGTGVA